MSGFETNHAEEQAMELEALEAIYAEAFKVTSQAPLAWQVHLEPTEGGVGEVNHVGVDFSCSIPEKYPDEAPEVNVEVTKGLTPKQRDELLLLAQEQARDNVGMAMGYTIAECIKEWLADNNVPSAADGSMHGEMLRRMAEGDRDRRREKEEMEKAAQARAGEDEDDEAIRRRRQADGTPVTPQTFAAWKAKFDADMRSQKSSGAEVGPKKPSGKEMFLRHLVAEEDEGPEGDEGDNVEMVIGDEGAFLDDDGDDLDDDLDGLSDEDEAG